MNAVLKYWSVFRVIRLAIGIMMIIQGFDTKDALPAVAGVLFSGMALFDAGYCAIGNCTSSTKTKPEKEIREIQYEEVK